MITFRSFAVLAVTAVLGQQLVACSSQVSASESERLAALWNGFHADVRLVVYDDLNANLNRRKVAYNTDLSVASEDVKAMIQGLAPTRANLHCNENSTIYVLEITEAGNKRKYSSDNNHCQHGASYAGYVSTQAMAQLAHALSATQAY
ncbi:MAG: hypothetical protein Q8M88_14665 [Phenylobacterium sp.]|uniref:hypothetical protein n=1 Tax=Phenylobacterium sp. TaxID=1871053 RepID=UPI0027334B2D|nr:hypothetical protein [Phenylobacterium sp.]MDP3175672.1 hypothetical protein [Phenylobacterium sp.]MDP3521343.1 hypothetical protein [Hydrogenophaga sp.]